MRSRTGWARSPASPEPDEPNLKLAIYDLAEVVAKPVFGAVADRWGMKQTMLAGIALFILASTAYPRIDPRLLLVVRRMWKPELLTLGLIPSHLAGS